MDTRTLLAGLAAGVTGFLLGWLLFGILLMDYFQGNIAQYDGLMRTEEEFGMISMLVGNLLLGFLLAWLFSRMNVTTFTGGAVDGLIIGLLIYGSMSLYYYAMMNWYTSIAPMLVEILVNGIWMAVMGGVAAAVLGMKRSVAAA